MAGLQSVSFEFAASPSIENHHCPIQPLSLDPSSSRESELSDSVPKVTTESVQYILAEGTHTRKKTVHDIVRHQRPLPSN